MESTTRRPTQAPNSTKLGARAARLTALFACISLAPAAAPPAEAAEFRVSLEPAVGLWLDEPQSDRFLPSAYGAFRPGVSLGEIVTLQWSYAMLFAPADEGFEDLGVGSFFTTGVRVRPFGAARDEDDQLAGISVDGNVGYVRTGDLNRTAFDVGLGYNFGVGERLALGPIVRFSQILQPDDLFQRDPNDAQFLTAGLNFTFGPRYVAEVPVVCPECVQRMPTVIERTVTAPPPACPDRDGDGICDNADRCPTQAG